MKEILLQAQELRKHFSLPGLGTLKAVDGIDVSLRRGETLGLVGESGCGKSTAGRTLVGLYEPTSGTVRFRGEDTATLSGADRKAFIRSAQMIFQDPYASLDPRMTVGDIVAEGLDIHGLCRGKARTERVYDLLALVGLGKSHADRYAHEFSGGQRQRIGIARALAVDPALLVCDEPISALDVSIQAQVINLLVDLQERLDLAYLFISHDLGMVRYISDRVAVMYLGKIVETGPSESLYAEPLHPYTQALLSAIPLPDPDRERHRRRIVLEGDVPSPIDPPAGCPFFGRCPRASGDCASECPPLSDTGGGHSVACHRV
ncbi:ATP-binding cassette domain-containing protein [Aminithiophilus ramosus]|uniref:ATP-binding cassette domain-containing protein n=1 Tax=Aminithiophilus ramosus TaxID=3029084 RepID=A0A9Q7AE37_9BACT|nr:oligopeptide/dipeptide ABC transporter ATP-binding protein [Aminithiophilus ramosus]QTX32654.1 ATP-binding cassette domain-containing protein [Aminithiophilus ramosus]